MNHVAKWAPHVARVVLGLIFFVFGLNGFLHFLPQPPMPSAVVPFVTGLMSTGYFFPLLKGTEVLAGILLLSNRLVPLALTLLAPIIVNITMFHFVLAPPFVFPIVIVAIEIYLAWSYRAAFRPMLQVRVKPAVSGDANLGHDALREQTLHQ